MREEIEVSVLDANGNELKNGALGQIAISSPTVCERFINRPEETKRIFTGNKMLTGDLGYKDSQGHLFFKGRHMRFTKIAAQMTDLAEIERVVTKHAEVKEVIATVRSDELRGDYVYCEVSTSMGASLNPKDIFDHCRKYIASHKIPRSIDVVRNRFSTVVSNPKTAWEGMR